MDLFFQEKEKTFSDSDFFQVMLLLRFYNNKTITVIYVALLKKNTQRLYRGGG